MINSKISIKNLKRVSPDNENRKYSLCLDLNENITGLPKEFINEVCSKIDGKLLSKYPNYKALQEKIAKSHSLLYENICLGNGSDGLIKNIFDTFINPGDKIIVSDPTFAMYNVYAKMFSADVISIPYSDDFNFPAEKFKSEITSEIKLLVIVSPNNPTGHVINNYDLEEIISISNKNNVLVIVDEAYHYFSPSTALPLVNKFKNVVVLRTFSKLCALAAIRIGYLIGSKEIVNEVQKVKPTFDINGVGVLFAEAILDRPDIIKTLVKDFQESKKFFNNRLEEEGFDIHYGEGNFTLIDVGSHVEFIMEKLSQENILVAGNFPQPFLSKYIRVTIADKDSMEHFLVVFLNIFKKFIKN